ncbi:MAG: hypothetical protein WCW13_06720 [archaeon]|jgi:hypothetical protein
MKKILVLGIKLTPYPFENTSLSQGVQFDLRVEKGSPANPLFYSSPKLRKILEKHPELVEYSIGHYSFDHAPHTKEGRAVFEENPDPFGYLEGRVAKEFKRKGIALEIERKVVTELRKRFGPIIIEPFLGISSRARNKQMFARRVNVSKEIPSYSLNADEVLARINAVRRKNRVKFRKPNPLLKQRFLPGFNVKKKTLRVAKAFRKRF